MFIRELKICGYKNFGERFTAEFSEGLNVLIGENGSGKSAIIDAIRLLLLEDEYGRNGVSENDFYKPFVKDAKSAEQIEISCTFDQLNDTERIAFLPWTEINEQATLNVCLENNPNYKERYKRRIWGGVSQSAVFEWELLDAINCIYLPPLRDAETKLRESRGSRLARLFKNLHKKELQESRKTGTPLPLEQQVRDFNTTLANEEDGVISSTNELIKNNLKRAIGTVFGQETLIQFSEASFSRIVENLRLLFFPNILQNANNDHNDLFRSLEVNSLGYNNLIYLATVLAEFDGIGREDMVFFKILLIEEPEAHLHPQLQIRLLNYLETAAKEHKIQIIVTTHSPTLASSVSLDTIKVLSRDVEQNPHYTALSNCGLKKKSQFFLERWLDITKSVLFFSKGIILVEGIAEALVLPELARIVLEKFKQRNNAADVPESLEEKGVSVINMNGIYFKHFMQPFAGYLLSEDENILKTDFIPIRCAGITDCDPQKDEAPTNEHRCECKNSALELRKTLEQHSIHCRLFSNLKTFEYDLAMEDGNLNVMIQVFLELLETEGDIRKEYQAYANEEWAEKSDNEKTKLALKLLDRVSEKKGEFAQLLAYELRKGNQQFSVPNYLEEAVLWAMGLTEHEPNGSVF